MKSRPSHRPARHDCSIAQPSGAICPPYVVHNSLACANRPDHPTPCALFPPSLCPSPQPFLSVTSGPEPRQPRVRPTNKMRMILLSHGTTATHFSVRPSRQLLSSRTTKSSFNTVSVLRCGRAGLRSLFSRGIPAAPSICLLDPLAKEKRQLDTSCQLLH